MWAHHQSAHLHGQVIGAAVQGLGSVLTEEIAYDENGQLLSIVATT